MSKLSKEALITSINNNIITLSVNNCSACSGCSAKKYCGLSESTDKKITTYVKSPNQYHIGEKVDISIDLLQGIRAIVYSYLIPLILMVLTIIVTHLSKFSDVICGISGIIILIPYYFGLFLAKNRIKLNSRFIISKKDATNHG